jgi:hypothetical protein
VLKFKNDWQINTQTLTAATQKQIKIFPKSSGGNF